MYILEKDNNRVIKNSLDNYLIPPKNGHARRSQTLH